MTTFAEETARVEIEVREIAAKTAAEIRRRGLIKGELAMIVTNPIFGPPSTLFDCEVCLVGAVNAAVFGDPTAHLPGDDSFVGLPRPVRELYARIADDAYGEDETWGASSNPVTACLEWNDHSATTESQVLAVLDKIAAG